MNTRSGSWATVTGVLAAQTMAAARRRRDRVLAMTVRDYTGQLNHGQTAAIS
jgi:hypothetical protein